MAILSARSVTISCNSRGLASLARPADDKPDIQIIHSNGFCGIAVHNGAGINIKVWLSADDAVKLSAALLEPEQLELTP